MCVVLTDKNNSLLATLYKQQSPEETMPVLRYLIYFFEIIIVCAVSCFRHDNPPEWSPITLTWQASPAYHPFNNNQATVAQSNIYATLLFCDAIIFRPRGLPGTWASWAMAPRKPAWIPPWCTFWASSHLEKNGEQHRTLAHAMCSMKWPSETHAKTKPVFLGDVQTVWTAEGCVCLGDRLRQLQQRATGVEQKPTIRRWPPLAPTPRGSAHRPHAGGGEGASEGGRRVPPKEEGAAHHRGGHLEKLSPARRRLCLVELWIPKNLLWAQNCGKARSYLAETTQLWKYRFGRNCLQYH